MTVTPTDFDDPGLSAWWDESYDTDALIRNTFFQSRHWNQCWSDTFVAPDARRTLMLLRVEDRGRIVAAIPLFLQRRVAGPITAWRYFLWIGDELAQYPDMVTTQRDTAPVWEAAIGFLARAYPDAWLHLRDMLPESTHTSLQSRARVLRGEPYLRLSLAGQDAQQYLARCTPHLRRNILRARKQLTTDAAMHWHAVRDPDARLIDRLIDLSIMRFGKASWFADERNRTFFRALCARAGHEVLFTVVEHAGEPVHIVASYLHGDVVHYVLSGMDIRWTHLRPGTMNLDATIRWAMHEGYSCFDFLRGDERYKREFGPDGRNGMALEIPLGGNGLRRSLARAARRLRRMTDRSTEDRP